MDYSALIGRIAALAAVPNRMTNAVEEDRVVDRSERGMTREGRLRGELVAADPGAVAALCRTTGFFTEAEIAVATELAADRLARGDASDYRFLVLEAPDRPVLAYACYGPIAATRGAWDLYWIVVDRAAQGTGLGSRLLAAVIAEAAAAGGTQLYAETEATPLYAPTRAFYAGRGFRLLAVLPDFYAPGRGKQIWMRPLSAAL